MLKPTEIPWVKKTIQFDGKKWPTVKFMAATSGQTIRDWLNGLIEEAIKKAKLGGGK